MEQRKLELKEICGYLPYELKMFCEGEEIETIECWKSKKYSEWDENEEDEIITGTNLYESLKDAKIILRPITDLHKTIIHNGKEIVPIVELAKIAVPSIHWRFWNNIAISECQYTHSIKAKFDWCDSENYFIYTGKEGAVKNIDKLFDYLHEFKIDYRGLTDAGLAVSVYDLDSNHYK